MAEITTNFNLSEKNTFGLTAFAGYYSEINDLSGFNKLFEMTEYRQSQKLILGGGSNILFTRNFDGLVIHPVFEGIEEREESGETVLIRVGSGVVWDDLVQYTVDNNWGGIENLTDIPGNVGAAPVQNIGAYGVEVKDSIVAVETIDLETGLLRTYTNAECVFGYRNSIFKERYKNRLLITHVSFKSRPTGC